MTDLLITTILSALAVTYVIELVELVSFGVLGTSLLNKILTLPLSFLAVYSQYEVDKKLIISVPAATLLSIVLSRLLNKPTVIKTNRLPKLY